MVRRTMLSSRSALRQLRLGVVFATGLFLAPQLRAASSPELPIDGSALVQLEQKARLADPREQCYLYTEVLHQLTELAGQQIAAGNEEEAHKTVLHIDLVVASLQRTSSRDARRIKNAELLLEHTTRRLADIARVVSSEERDVMLTTLKHVSAAHTDLLALVFAK